MATDAGAKTMIKAICWQAGAPDKRLQGELEYGTTSGAEVDLFGQFLDGFDEKKFVERFTLHGHTLNAKPVSLFSCLNSGGVMHFPGGRSSNIISSFGVLGGHYQSPDEIMFKKVEVQFKGLIQWTCITGIGFKVEENPRSIAATYKIPATIEIGKFGPFSARLEISGKVQPGFHSFDIKEECTFVLEAEQMQPYLTFEKYIHAFQHFLSLAIQHPVCALKIVGQVDKPRMVVQDGPVFDEFLIIQKISVPDWEVEQLVPQLLLFNLQELSPSPAVIFEKFIERREKLRASMDLYFSTVYNEAGIPRVEFLTLAQSLEAYHRVTMPGKYVCDDIYKSGLRAMFWGVVPFPPEIDVDFRAALDVKLNYLHEFSLRRRLKELAIRCTPVLEALIGDPKVFAESVSNLRNRLTHPGEGCDDLGNDFNRIIGLSEKMTLLLEVCFLFEIGFTQDAIKEIVFNRSKRAYRIHQGWA